MSSKNYQIEPPPKDGGKEPLFRVIYAIDVGAADERKAAETAWQMMRAEDAFEPVMVILDSNGKQTKLDLSEYLEFNKVTTGFVVQKYRKNRTGKFRCIHQEFVAGDDVQFENLKGESIEEPEHEYQPFNMMLPTATIIKEQCPDVQHVEIKVNILSEGGQIWIQPEGYGEKCATDGEGFPVGIEIWQGRLRLIVFDDINREDPQIIDLESARETARKRCNWCKKEIDTESIKWKSLLFCSEPCLDACRAAQ